MRRGLLGFLTCSAADEEIKQKDVKRLLLLGRIVLLQPDPLDGMFHISMGYISSVHVGNSPKEKKEKPTRPPSSVILDAHGSAQ